MNSEDQVTLSQYDGILEIPLVGDFVPYFGQATIDAIKLSVDRSDSSLVLFFNVDEDAGKSMSRGRLNGFVRWLLEYPQPTIFSIRGDLRDATLEFAMACDIRVASPSATYGMTQIARGQMPNDGGVQLLTRLVGPGIATDMLLTGRKLNGAEALDHGLVNYLYNDPALEAKDLAITIATHGRLAAKYTKEAVNAAGDLTFEQGARLEADLSFMLHGTPEREEGLAAFRAGRDPQQ